MVSTLLEHYKVLGVNVGAGIADITSSYKRLCRIYHPDVNDDPQSEELMKRINVAYTVLREKLRREAAFRDRQTYSRPARRYTTGPDTRPPYGETHTPGNTRDTYDTRGATGAAHTPDSTRDTRGATGATHTPGNTRDTYDAGDTRGATAAANMRRTVDEPRKTGAQEEKEASAVLNSYFVSISTCDYASAYDLLSSYDRQYVTRESFIDWRKSVARLFPMREFKIAGGHAGMILTLGNGKTLLARKFRVTVTEEDVEDERMQVGEIDKMVICEDGIWKVFLGYKGVVELTRGFDERFEEKKKNDIAKRWDEYYAGLSPEYNMLSIGGMHKAASREIYRQKRFGGTLTFAVISVRTNSFKGAGLDELIRSSARTIVGALRETDVPCYAGDGVFAVLFVGLRKKNAVDIIVRLTDKIRRNAGTQLGGKASIEYAHDSWSGHEVADFDALNKVLVKFQKKL